MTKKKLTVWVFQDGEFLPIDSCQKKLRTWKLVENLRKHGHNIVWWASTFDHFNKKNRFSEDTSTLVEEGFEIRLLNCGSYKKNISFARLLHHVRLGKKLWQACNALDPKPDIIIASYPIIEFSIVAEKINKKFDIPFIIDIRDLWPDTFKMLFPKWSGFLLDVAFLPYNRTIRKRFRTAQKIVAINKSCLEWGLQKAQRLSDNLDQDIIYLGADEQEKSSESIEKLDAIPKDKVIYSHLGSLGKLYEVELILEAAEILAKEKSNVHFVIAGNGIKKRLIECRSSTLPNVTYLGWLNKDQCSAVMERTSVMLLMCKNLALPNKFYDAGFYHKPMIVSSLGATEEIIIEPNIRELYEHGNVSSFIIAVKNLLSLDKREKMSAHFEKLYKEKYNHETIYSKYVSLIEQAAGL